MTIDWEFVLGSIEMCARVVALERVLLAPAHHELVPQSPTQDLIERKRIMRSSGMELPRNRVECRLHPWGSLRISGAKKKISS